MDLLNRFKEYLFSQEDIPSKVTVKNYLSDVNHFFSWFEKRYNSSFSPSQVSPATIEEYKKDNSILFSASSLNRHLSTLRKFFKFLKDANLITFDPFVLAAAAANKEEVDPWKLKEFKSNLYEQNSAHLTIKNYIIDIKQFIAWAKQATGVSDDLLVSRIDKGFVEEYKKRLTDSAGFSPATVNRKLSSLRKYLSWAHDQGLVTEAKLDINNINEAKQKLYIPQTSAPTKEKLKKEYSKFPPLRLFQKFSQTAILAFDAILIAPLALTTLKAQAAFWKFRGQPIFKKGPATFVMKNITPGDLLGIKNISKKVYAPMGISTKSYTPLQKIIFHLRYTRPNWYKRYHSYSIAHYLNFAVLIIVIVGLSIGFYNGFVKNSGSGLAANPNLPTAPNRILSFQGRLTDNNDNPITTPSNLRFAVYRDPSATGGGNLLWQEVDQVSPDQDGIFNVVLGNTSISCPNVITNILTQCTIPSTLFSQNNALFLGVSVESTSELTPRQQIATVAFAANSETLQGLLPITATTSGTTNVVLALDSSGNLTIGGTANPVFSASGGTFKLSGQPLLLTTNTSSNSNVTISTDGLGKIDFQKPIQNNTLTGNLKASGANGAYTAAGAVEVDDLFAVLATSSGQSAFTLDQEGAGPIISASQAGTAKFTVDNGGSLTSAGTINGLTVSGGVISSGTWNGTAISSTFGGTGIDSHLSTGVPYISSGTWSVDTNALTAVHGGTGQTVYATGDLLYASSTTALSRLAVGTATQCLIGGTTPSWSSCSAAASNYWQLNSGALSPFSSTADVLIGDSATTSAEFAFTGLGLANHQTQASISGNLIVMPNNGYGGNVGIGTTAPTRQLHIYGAGQTTAALTDSGNTGSTLFLQDSGFAAGSGGGILFGANGANNGSYQSFAAIKGLLTNGSPNSTGDLAFSTRNAAGDVALTERMRILADGNVGIGTTAPNALLHLESSAADATSLLRLHKASSVVGTGTGFLISGLDTPGNLTNYGGFQTLIADATDGSEDGTVAIREMVAGSLTNVINLVAGNVGIGTTGPDRKLDVLDASSPQLRLTQADGTVYSDFQIDGSGNLTIDNTGTKTIIADDLQVTGNDILDSAAASRINFSSNTITLGSTTTISDATLTTITSSIALNLNPNTGTSYTLDTSATTLTAFGTPTSITLGNAASTFNIGPGGSTATTINLAGGNSATGCTVDGATGNLNCSGNIIGAGTGVIGYWQRNIGALSPTNIGDDVLLGSISTASAAFAFTGLSLTNHHTQASISGQLIVMPNNGYGGNVGIGNTTPPNLLSIALNSTTDPSAGGLKGITLTNQDTTANSLEGLVFQAYDDGGTGRHGAAIAMGKGSNWVGGSGNYPGFLSFWTRPAGANESERMRIDSAGNVGIGTTTPVALLDVAGMIRVGNSGVVGTQGTYLVWNKNLFGGTSFINEKGGGTGGFAWYESTSGDVQTERMRIDGSGNVGIGTTGPNGTLSIVSSNATGTTTSSAVNLTANSLTTGTGLDIASTSLSTGKLVRIAPTFGNGAGGVGYGLYIDGTDTSANGNSDYAIYSTISNTGASGKSLFGLRSAPSTISTTSDVDSVYGVYTSITAQHNTAAGIVNGYGLYVANGTMDGNGITTQYGLYVENLNTADTNYAAVFAGGNVGIGTTSPSSLLSVGSTSQFQVNSSGAIAAAAGITSSGAITFSNLNTNGGVLYTNGSGTLSQTGTSTNTQCLIGGTAPSWSSCSAAANNYWQLNQGAIAPFSNKADVLIGSSSTSSAAFAFTGLSSLTHQTQASFSGQLIVMPNNGYGGNVGIGTTTPTQLLDIVGNTNGIMRTQITNLSNGTAAQSRLTLLNDRNSEAASAGLLTQYSSGNTASAFGVTLADYTLLYSQGTSSNGLIVGTGTADPIIFGTNNTENMRIASGGNVGIGTTGPLNKLQTVGVSQFNLAAGGIENLSSGATVEINNASGTNSWMVFRTAGNAGGGIGVKTGDTNVYLSNIYAGYSDFGSASKSITLANTGKVGIGTTSPTTFKLEVAGSVGPSADNTYDLGSSGRRWANVYATNLVGAITPSGFTQGPVVFGGASGALAQDNGFWWDNTNKRVGIGTTAPDAKLTVGTVLPGTAHSATFAADAGALGATATNELAVGSFGGTTGNATSLGIRLYREASSPTDWTTSGIQLSMDVDSTPRAGAYIELSHSGNVGVGTVTPGQKLDVAGNALIESGKVYGPSSGGNVYMDLGVVTANRVYFNSDSPGYFNLGPNMQTILGSTGLNLNAWNNVGVSQSYVQNSGNAAGVHFGINNTNPQYALEVTANAASNWAAYIHNDSATGAGLKVVASDAGGTQQAFEVLSGAGPTSRFLVRSDGNVGIGTTSPLAVLDLYKAEGSPGSPLTSGTATNALARVHNGSTNAVMDIGGMGGSPFTGWIQMTDVTNLAGTYPLALNPNGGNVGIGTTSPGYKLDVAGDINTSGAYRLGGSIGMEQSGGWLRINQANQFANGTWFGSSNIITGTGHLYAGSTGLSGEVDISGTNGDNTNRITINGNSGANSWFNTSGNVGIGTTNPASNLEVQSSGDTTSRVRTTGTGNFVIDLTTPAGTGPRIHFGNSTTNNSFMTLGAYASINQIDTKTRDFHLYGTDTSTGFYFKESTGNFGIGTTAPGAKLDVVTGISSDTYSGTIIGEKASSTLSGVSATGNHTGASAYGYKSIVGESWGNGATGYGYYSTPQIEQFQSLTNYYGLYLDGITHTGTGNGTVSTNYFGVYQQDSGAKNYFAGNVGIGTTAPKESLDLAGTLGTTGGNIILGTYNNTVSRYIGMGSGTTGTFTANSGFSGIEFGGAATGPGEGYIAFHTHDAGVSSGERMRIDKSGNVGIGTTSPGRLLDVNGIGAIRTLYVDAGNNLNDPTAGNQTGTIELNNSGTNAFKMGMAAVRSSNYDMYFQTGAINGGGYRWYIGTAEKMTMDKSGNVGIGTTAPTALMEVYNSYSATTPSFKMRYNDGTNYDMSIYPYVVGGGNVGYKFVTTNGASSSNTLALTGAGLVGIGTTAPGYKLDVSGTGHYTGAVTFDSTTTHTGQMNLPTGAGANYIGAGTGDGASYSTYNFVLSGWYGMALTDYSGTVHGVYDFRTGNWTTDGVAYFKGTGINSFTGRVGIGTTAPDASLNIAGSQGCCGRTTQISNATGALNIMDGDGSNWYSWGVTSGNIWEINSGTSFSGGGLNINSSNNVGIGTTAPQVKLDLTGSLATFTTGTEDEFHLTRLVNSGVSYPQIAAFQLGTYNNSGACCGPQTRLDINLKAAANNTLTGDTNVMTLLSSGNVGIGTTSPGVKLDVRNATDPEIHVQESTTVRLRLGVPTAAGDIAVNSLQYAAILTNDAGAVQFGTAASAPSTVRMTIDTSGNVGIGTTGPGDKLVVAGNIDVGTNAYKMGTNADMEYNSGLVTRSSGNFYYRTTGNVDLMTILSTGTVGIGKTPSLGTLDVNGNTASLYYSTASWDFGNSTNMPSGETCSQATNTLCFARNGGAKAMSLTTAGKLTIASTLSQTGTPDIAENINVLDTSINSGDIVSSVVYDSTKDNIYSQAVASKATVPYSSNMIGAMSENPGFVLNSNIDENLNTVDDPHFKPLTIGGRIPVKVSTINGQVKTGDSITSSQIPGIGMKATKAGSVLGTALTDYTDSDATQSARLSNGDWVTSDGTCANGEQNCYNYEKVLVFVNLSYSDPDTKLASTQNFNFIDTTPGSDWDTPHVYTLNDPFGMPIDKVGAFADLTVSKLRAGFISAGQIEANAIKITSDNVSIAGRSLHDYIASIVTAQLANIQNLTTNNIVSPIAQIDELHTNLISPVSNDSKISLKLDKNKISIINEKNGSGSAVASFDNSGNATLAGQLSSDSLSVAKDATIAGVLHVSKIIADQIEGLNIKTSTISANYITNNYYNSSSSAFPTLPASGGNSSQSGNFNGLFAQNNYINIASFSSQLAQIDNLSGENGVFNQNLTVFGSTTLSDTSVVGQLSVGGNLILADRSINVLGSDLNLQPLRQGGLSIMSGLIYVDTNGNIKFGSDATINGTLYANAISPLPGKDLAIKLSTSSAITNKIAIKGNNGTDILSIDNLGNLAASGAGTFAKLNLNNIIGTALAVSPTEVIATGSAGTVMLKANKTEVTINNKLVTQNSLIYITPMGSTGGQNLFLSRQVPDESFTVGISNPITQDTKFNFLIVN